MVRSLWIAYLGEIVNYRLYSMLYQLRVREHPEQGPYVEGLSTYPAVSYQDITVSYSLEST